MDIDGFKKWINEYFGCGKLVIEPTVFDYIMAGYEYAKKEHCNKTNEYQRQWRAKNKEKYSKLIEKYRAKDGDFERRKEYQRKYYQKRKTAAKIKIDSL